MQKIYVEDGKLQLTQTCQIMTKVVTKIRPSPTAKVDRVQFFHNVKILVQS